jgi:hypothetical protein
MYTKYFAEKPRALVSVCLCANTIFRLICAKLCVCVLFGKFYLFWVSSTCPGRDVCEVLWPLFSKGKEYVFSCVLVLKRVSGEWRTEGGLGGFEPPLKFRSFDKAEPK